MLIKSKLLLCLFISTFVTKAVAANKPHKVTIESNLCECEVWPDAKRNTLLSDLTLNFVNRKAVTLIQASDSSQYVLVREGKSYYWLINTTNWASKLAFTSAETPILVEFNEKSVFVSYNRSTHFAYQVNSNRSKRVKDHNDTLRMASN